jgi:signal transduction histidine kinase
MIGFALVLRDVTEMARSDAQRRQVLGEVLRDAREPLAAIRSLSESLLADRPPRADLTPF